MTRTALSFVVALSAWGLLPLREAAAQTLRGNSSTLVAGREIPRWDDTTSSIPIYELLSLDVSKLSLPGFDGAELVLQGWGRLELGDTSLAKNDADLGLLYLSAKRGPITLRLGRQHLTTGLGRMRLLDGIDAKTEIRWGFSVEAFFGAVVHRNFDYDRGSWQTGARLAKRLPGPGEVGVSFIQERDVGYVAHEEVGLDGFYMVGPVRLLALAVASPRDNAFVEGRLGASWFLRKNAVLTLDIRHVVPALFLPATSIFSVFSNVKHDSLGCDAAWQPDPYWDLDLNGDALILGGSAFGYRAAARAVTYREREHRSLIGLEVSRLDEDMNGYLRGRIFSALQPLRRFRAMGDVFLYGFDSAINGVSRSLVVQLSSSYDLYGAWKLVGTTSAGTTPLAEGYIEAMLRLDYGFSFDFSRQVPR